MVNSLYRRLAVSNLIRNRRLYMPYFIATAIMSSIFFIIINTVFSRSVGSMSYGGTMTAMLTIGVVIMCIYTVGYMLYINSFLMKRRKKEFGLYGILGLEKRHVGRIILLENVLLDSLSLLLGLLCGTVFGKLAFMALMTLVHTAPDTSFVIAPMSYLVTVAIFIGIFIVCTIYNQLQVRLANPIDLINGEKKGEKKLRGVVPLTLLGLACLVGAYYLAITVSTAVSAIALFWPLVLLVIIATYSLMAAGSQFVLTAMKKSKRFYYKPRNFIAVSGLIHRMKQNASGLANICILCCMVIITMSGCLSLYCGQETILAEQFPDDFTMTMWSNQGETYDGEKIDEMLQALAIDKGVKLTSCIRYEAATAQAAEIDGRFYFRNKDGNFTDNKYAANKYWANLQTITVITLEDYNRVSGRTASLAPDEMIITSNRFTFPAETLSINGSVYRISEIRDDSPIVDGGNEGYTDRILFVASDRESAEKLIGAMRDDASYAAGWSVEIALNMSGSSEGRLAFAREAGEVVYGTLDKQTGGGWWYETSSIDTSRASSYMTYGGLLFMGILFTMLFITNTVIIMYFKQVSEGYDDRERFVIMQKVGMSDLEVKKTINHQVLTVFFIPLLMALCHMLAASNLMVMMLQVFVMTDSSLVMLCIAGTTLLMALVYVAAYRATAKAYYKLVKW